MTRSDRESYVCNRASAREIDQRKVRTRDLNDAFRRNFAGGLVTITPGLKALGADFLSLVITEVQSFRIFTPENDLYHEHDFGAVDIRGERIFWKIDCYDKRLEYGSPDPSDPGVTTRVLTIMLASEY